MMRWRCPCYARCCAAPRICARQKCYDGAARYVGACGAAMRHICDGVTAQPDDIYAAAQRNAMRRYDAIFFSAMPPCRAFLLREERQKTESVQHAASHQAAEKRHMPCHIRLPRGSEAGVRCVVRCKSTLLFDVAPFTPRRCYCPTMPSTPVAPPPDRPSARH